jgi:hypothetical protein
MDSLHGMLPRCVPGPERVGRSSNGTCRIRKKITEESNKSGALSLSDGAPRVLALGGPRRALIANLHCGAAGIAALPVLRRTVPEAKSVVLAAETTKSFDWRRHRRSVGGRQGSRRRSKRRSSTDRQFMTAESLTPAPKTLFHDVGFEPGFSKTAISET